MIRMHARCSRASNPADIGQPRADLPPASQPAPSVRRRPSTTPPLALALLVLFASAGDAAEVTPRPDAPAVPGTGTDEGPPDPTFDIGPATLGTVLGRIGLVTRSLIVVDPDLIAGLQSPGLKGRHSTRSALESVLSPHGLEALAGAEGGYRVRRRARSTDASATPPSQSAASTPIAGSLAPVRVVSRNPGASPLADDYAGGQVAQGGQLGFLGNVEFLDAPFSVTAYTQRYLEDRGAQRLSDVIGLADPSVEFDRVNGYAEQISIRGFPAAAQDISYGGLYGVLPSMRIYPELAERIEILRGPSAMLNGMMPDGSVGGTINIVPKRAGPKPLARLTTSYSSRRHLGAHIDVAQRFGAEQSFGIRFNGMYRSGETEVHGQDKQVGLGTLGLDWVGRHVRLSADFIASREHARGFGYWGFYGDLLDGGVPRPASPSRFMNSPDSYYTNIDQSGVLRAEITLPSDWLFYVAAGTRSSRFQSLANHIDINNLAGDTTDGWYYWKTRSNTHTGLAGLRGRFETGPLRHELNLSATGYQNRSNEASEAFFDDPYASNIHQLSYSAPPDTRGVQATPYVPWLRETLRSLGIADTLTMAEGRLKLTLGIRHQWIDSRDLQLDERYTTSANSPSVAAVWNLQPGLSLYGNYSTGLSTGGVAPTDAANAGQILPPIRTRQHELGLKKDFGTWAATVSLFQIQRPGADYDPATNVWGLVGNTRNRGLEVLTMGEPLPGTRVLGGIAFNNARYQSDANEENAGRRVIGIPARLLKLGIEQDLQAVPGLTLTAGVIHSSSQALRASNNAFAPAWTRWDLGARHVGRWAGRRVILRADLQNLTNKAYWLSPAFNGMGAPRTLLLSATVDLL